jgi:hypothetical protein
MAGPGQILSRTFFWSYERGTWQYDVAVALILVFVLLTPRSWFHDQPQVGIATTSSQVQLVSTAGSPDTYQIDARVLAPPVRTPMLSNELHTVLQRSLPELSDGRFSIAKIDAVRDDKGTVIAYRVEIRR